MEQWKDVKGYEGYYEVSSLGRVRSTDRIVNSSSRNGGVRSRPAVVLKQKKQKNGYLSVSLGLGGEVRSHSVHRLVAFAFLPELDGRDAVNHINLNKCDNRVTNLEWCTAKENTAHKQANGGWQPTPLRKELMCLETGEVFASSYQAAEWLNETKFQYTHSVAGMARNIRAAASGKVKSSFSYHWQDVNSEPPTTIPKGSTPKRVEKGVSS